MLQEIPRAYQQQEFSAIAQAIRIVEGGDVTRAMADLEKSCQEMDGCVKVKEVWCAACLGCVLVFLLLLFFFVCCEMVCCKMRRSVPCFFCSGGVGLVGVGIWVCVFCVSNAERSNAACGCGLRGRLHVSAAGVLDDL